MLKISLMIEGQNGLTWQRWQRIAQATEDLGFAGLYRSDHYTNAKPPDKESLELWVSLTWLASHTQRIEFGSMVSPVSFRDPTMTARMASAVDDLSNGRLVLGLGAGWQEREHTNYGWHLLSLPERFARFEEGLTVISHLLNNDDPVTFEGKFYTLNEAILLPRPHRPGGPPILIGGNGPRYTLPLVAKYATHWNAVFIPPTQFTELNTKLNELLTANNRHVNEISRSLMTGCCFGLDETTVEEKATTYYRQSAKALRKSGLVVGSPNEVVDQLGRFAEAGVQEIMLQWLDLDDLDGLEAMAKHVLSQF